MGRGGSLLFLGRRSFLPPGFSSYDVNPFDEMHGDVEGHDCTEDQVKIGGVYVLAEARA